MKLFDACDGFLNLPGLFLEWLMMVMMEGEEGLWGGEKQKKNKPKKYDDLPSHQTFSPQQSTQNSLS